jgi:hypothetical protein
MHKLFRGLMPASVVYFKLNPGKKQAPLMKKKLEKENAPCII